LAWARRGMGTMSANMGSTSCHLVLCFEFGKNRAVTSNSRSLPSTASVAGTSSYTTMLFVAALLVASVAASGDDALPQPEVEFDDGTTTPMILTKLASEKELVVTGCGLNAAPRLCGMSLGIEANMASGAANAADIAANTVLISGLQTSVDTLRTATLAEDKALRASSTALGIETAQLRKENALMRAALVSLTARLDTLDSKHDDDLKRLEELHAADVAALAVHNAASDAADKELGAAIVEVEKMQGPQGAKGEKGEKGEQGEKGAAATLPPTPPPTPPPNAPPWRPKSRPTQTFPHSLLPRCFRLRVVRRAPVGTRWRCRQICWSPGRRSRRNPFAGVGASRYASGGCVRRRRRPRRRPRRRRAPHLCCRLVLARRL